MSAPQRGEPDEQAGDLIERHADELAQLEALDNGKAISRGARGGFAADDRLLPLLRGLGGQESWETIPVSGNYFTYTKHEPVGVVGQIIPWNFPLLMQAWKLGRPLATGLPW